MNKDDFLISCGSVTGSRHRMSGRNNQDGLSIATSDDTICAVVCDGCSSSSESEVGARMASRFIACAALKLMTEGSFRKGSEMLPSLEEAALDFLRKFADSFSEKEKAIDDMLLFTIMGAIVSGSFATIFSIGDGAYSLNGKTAVIDENNSPNYLGYRIIPGFYAVEESAIHFAVREEIETSALESMIIATDGAADIEAKAEQPLGISGSTGTVGRLSQFETEERYLRNAALVQRRLNQLAAPRLEIDWGKQRIVRSEGMLSDDTSVILVRRR